MTLRRCQKCAAFYDKKLAECPECHEPKYAANSWLYTAKLNGQLNSQAQGQRDEIQRYKQLKAS